MAVAFSISAFWHTATRPRQPDRASVSGLQLAFEPVEDDVEPLFPMAGLAAPGELVAFSREPDELGLHPVSQQGVEVLLGLLDRATEVVLRVDDQRRGADLRGEAQRAAVPLQLGAPQVALGEPAADVGGAAERRPRQERPFDDRRLP